MNTFTKYPQFISNDIRVNRLMHATSFELMTHRHTSLMPKDIIEGKSVLDIGCCVGATGAWALDNGASSYTGVELQEKFSNIAIQNFSECFSDKDWSILNIGFEEFFETNTKKYDVIYAGGVIYATQHYQKFLQNIIDIANDTIIIESLIPKIITLLPHSETSFLYPVTEYYKDGVMVHEDGGNMQISCAVPSLGAVTSILSESGYSVDLESFRNLRQHNISNSRSRWGAIFRKTKEAHVKNAEYVYLKSDTPITPWAQTRETFWSFNETVASIFAEHARKHIPDYDRVIDMCVDVCLTKTQDRSIKIIDVGCAIGETLERFHSKGYTNLYGVDNSEPMLNKCNKEIATLILNSEFPKDQGKFDVILCNWTLHFIENKSEYLTNMLSFLEDDGMLILTDKTKNDGIDLDLYHNFKLSKGCTPFEIQEKAKYVKNTMFINDYKWYFDTLKNLGFENVSIINAAPAFTTFLIRK